MVASDFTNGGKGSVILLPEERIVTFTGAEVEATPALLVATACLFWGIDNNLTRRISGSDPAQIAMWKGLLAGAVNTSLGLVLATSLPAAQTIAAIAAVGFFGYGLSLVLFITALRLLGTAEGPCSPGGRDRDEDRRHHDAGRDQDRGRARRVGISWIGGGDDGRHGRGVAGG